MTPDRRALSAPLRPLRGYAEWITERADTEARAAGLTVEVLPRGRRRYRDPRLDQLATHRVAAPYAGVRNAARADDETWSTPTLTASPVTCPDDRLRRADRLEGPGRYQTRSPASSRPAQDRFRTLRQERCAETILRSRLDPGHPAGPAPDALRAGSEEHAPARP